MLWSDINQHPLTGTGFGAYWNPDNLVRVQKMFSIPFPNAHNGFIEELLATGVVGLALLLFFWSYATYISVQSARQGDPFGWLTLLFVLFYLLLNLTQSIMQWYFELPFIVPLVLLGLITSKRLAGTSEPPWEVSEISGSQAGPAKEREAENNETS
jgi:O-antigen ligase